MQRVAPVTTAVAGVYLKFEGQKIRSLFDGKHAASHVLTDT